MSRLMHVNYVVHQHVNTAIYKYVVYTNGKVFLSGVAHYIQCIYKAGNLSPQNKNLTADGKPDCQPEPMLLIWNCNKDPQLLHDQATQHAIHVCFITTIDFFETASYILVSDLYQSQIFLSYIIHIQHCQNKCLYYTAYIHVHAYDKELALECGNSTHACTCTHTHGTVYRKISSTNAYTMYCRALDIMFSLYTFC